MKYNLKVLLISNNEYGKGLEDLCGANYITEQLYNYFKCIVLNPDEDVKFLKDIKHTYAINEISDFVKTIKDDYVFLFYFCGHGKMSSINMSELIMAVKDTSVDNIDSIGINFRMLVNKVKKENITKFICVIDSCCSGIINSAMGKNELVFNESDCDDGTVYISSVKGTLNAYEVEVDGKKVPCFSYSFWKALTERNDSDAFLYNIEDIFTKTKIIVSSLNNEMQPQISRTNFLSKEKIFPDIKNDDIIYNTLDVIDWRITSQCDNNCGMCYACNDDLKLEDLSGEKIDVVINKLSQIHCKTVCVSGGEPTKSKHFVKLMRKLYQKGFSIFLSTNGYKYMDYLNEVEKYIEKLSLPLDGYNEETNMNNGRNAQSFERVKKILDYYNEHEHNFPIKISTVLTSKTNNIEFLTKLLNFIKLYNISIWKIYEFIPENRGAKNKDSYYFPINSDLKRWIKKVKKDHSFKIELVERKNRNAAYFIIQSNGDVIIPIENNSSNIVNENKVGNIINDDLKQLVRNWENNVDENNYFLNTKLRNVMQLYFLRPFEKNILYNFISKDGIPSLMELSNFLNYTPENIETIINKLYRIRIVKNILPIINLKLFGISTYLANISISKYTNCPDGFIEDYLCYNAYIGWVTKCENNTFRVAIFAKSKQDAGKILQEIRKDLNNNIEYDCYDLICSYAVGEKKLFLSSSKKSSASMDIIKYNSNTQKQMGKVKLSYKEFYSLKQLENLRKPLKENVDDKVFLNTNINFNSNIKSLLKKGIIEKLSVILDTRLLGYKWYIVFVNVDNTETNALIEFLRTQFNNITHINSFIPQKSDWNLDFEIHVTSLAEVNEVIEQIEKQFNNIIIDAHTPLRIIKECKFSFLTHYTSDVILKNYILEDEQGEC